MSTDLTYPGSASIGRQMAASHFLVAVFCLEDEGETAVCSPNYRHRQNALKTELPVEKPDVPDDHRRAGDHHAGESALFLSCLGQPRAPRNTFAHRWQKSLRQRRPGMIGKRARQR